MANLTTEVANRQKLYFTKLFNILPNLNKLSVSFAGKSILLESLKDDAHVASCIQSRKAGVLSKYWELQQADCPENVVKTIEKLINRLPMNRIMSDMLDAVLFGYQPLEIDWQYADVDGTTLLVPIAIIAKPYDWFFFDEKNELRLRTIQNYDGELLDMRKFILVQHQPSYDNPYGEPVLSKCLWPIAFKKGGLSFWVRFAQKFGMPHYIGKTSEVRGSEQFDAMLDVLDDLIEDSSAVIPVEDDIEVVNPASSVNINIYKDLLEFCNKEISKAILSQTLTTDIGSSGSYAASNTHFEVRADIIQQDTILIEEAINHFIRVFIDINFGSTVQAPYFALQEVTSADKNLADVVNILTGAPGLKFTKKFYTERFGFQEDEFDIVENAPLSNTPQLIDNNQNKQDKKKPNLDEEEQEDKEFSEPNDDFIENHIQKSINDSNLYSKSIDKQIVQFLEKSNSYNEAMKGLAKLLPNLNDDVLKAKILRDNFWSRVVGEKLAMEEINGMD